jgi:hypothetical protein
MSDPTPESFAAVAALIALITDAPACKSRLAELRQQIDAAAKAQARLDAAQPIHDQAAAALETREAAVTERERQVEAWSGSISAANLTTDTRMAPTASAALKVGPDL